MVWNWTLTSYNVISNEQENTKEVDGSFHSGKASPETGEKATNSGKQPSSKEMVVCEVKTAGDVNWSMAINGTTITGHKKISNGNKLCLQFDVRLYPEEERKVST